MDRRAPAEAGATHDLVERCLHALGQLIPIESWTHSLDSDDSPGQGLDGTLHLTVDGAEYAFAVEAKRSIGNAGIGPVVQRARTLAEKGVSVVLCTTRVNEGVGQELRKASVGYLDLGGNAHLVANGLRVLVEGRRPVTRDKMGRTGLRGTEARLLGVFLRDHDAGELTQQELANRAGIAIGAVGRARSRLTEMRILSRMDKRRWRVTDREKGMRIFADGWAQVIRPKLDPVRYLATHGTHGPGVEDVLRVVRRNQDPAPCLVGGEWAAAALTSSLVTEHATLHVTPGERRRVIEGLRLVPDSEGPITLLDRYGSLDEFAFQWDLGGELAHPLLVWAECLTVIDERVASTAEEVRRVCLMGTP